jgi:hypothetical protein
MARIILEKSISVKNVADLHLLTYVATVVLNHIIKYQRNRRGEIRELTDKDSHQCIAWTSDNNGAYLCKVCNREYDG